MSLGRPQGSIKFSTEEAKERNKERNRLAYQQKKMKKLTSDEFVDLRKFNKGKIWLTDEERINQKRIHNLNCRNKKRLEEGLPLLTLDDIKCYKPKEKKSLVKEQTKVEVKKKKYTFIEFEIID
jgi:hypothetical protein